MKVSVCGKGGSGKSTVVTLLANEFKARGCHVLVVDSDESNSGLFRMLGFDHPPVPLMELVGGKRSLKDRMAVGFSSGGSEPKMEVLSTERILLKDISPPHIIERDNLSMISIGKILQSLEGCACPMGVLSREFLKKLHLGANEVAIVDMEAGVEHFGRGVETSIDSVLMVVEPSLESIELAARVKGLAEGAGVEHTWAVLNKIGSQDMALGLEEELGKRGVPVIGHVYYRPEIFEACLKGHKLAGESGGEGIRQVAARLLSG